ncbi:MAG: sigma 54-interacting transcriptional regulator [Myxococcota bacterium]
MDTPDPALPLEPLEWPADDERARACLRALASCAGAANDDSASVLQALDLAMDAVIVVDRDRRILYANTGATELTGYERADLLGRSCTEGLRFVTCAKRCALFDDEMICRRQCTMRTKSGGDLVVLKNARVLRDQEGRVVGGIESLQGLREILEPSGGPSEDVRRSTRRALLEAFAGSLDEAVLAVDETGRIAAASPGAADLLGAEPSAAVGHPLLELLGHHRGVAEELRRLLRDGGSATCHGVPLGPYAHARRATLELRALRGCDECSLGVAVTLRPVALRNVSTRHGMVAESPGMLSVIEKVERLADRDNTVLIMGESGTGKELVARALHTAGRRSDRPFHAVNCAALAEQLLESELFGHERGAFTGAQDRKPGRLELCEDGTLMLDEVGCLPQGTQAKLLRVLEQRQFERVGGTRTLPLRGRVVAATNADLEEQVARGEFRADLYYRLRVVPIEVPPLRRRPSDVLALARHFVRSDRDGGASGDPELTPAAEQALLAYRWPGNVRELRNAVVYAIALGDGRTVDLRDLPDEVRHQAAITGCGGPDTEATAIRRALAQARYNRTQAAELLGVSRTTLWRKMRKLGIG